MSLTTAQLVILKNAILGDSALAADVATGNQGVILDYMNADSSPAFIVWRSSVKVEEIYDAITWSALTPTDNPDDTQAWLNRSLACQGKQFNLQTMLTGRATISGAKPAIRAGLQDALTNVPSGTGGAAVNAGWAAVKSALSRAATRAEKLYATGAGTTAAPGSLVVDGKLAMYDIVQALTQV